MYKLSKHKNIRINGLFQSDKYLKYLNRITLNKFIKIKSNKINFDKNTCILNIRGGEYKRHKNLILPKIYWLNAMKLMSKINKNISFIVVTDDYRYAKSLFPNFEIISKNIHQCFVAIQNAPYLILSNSSFSFFPNYLTNVVKKGLLLPIFGQGFQINTLYGIRLLIIILNGPGLIIQEKLFLKKNVKGLNYLPKNIFLQILKILVNIYIS